MLGANYIGTAFGRMTVYTGAGGDFARIPTFPRASARTITYSGATGDEGLGDNMTTTSYIGDFTRDFARLFTGDFVGTESFAGNLALCG